MNFGIERIYGVHPWKVFESDFKTEKSTVSESIFSLANEYMGTRGLLEEGFPKSTFEGCFIGGIYVKEDFNFTWKHAGTPSFGNFAANTTNWLSIIVKVDGEEFSMDCSEYAEYERVLDMKEGTVTRELVFVTSKGYRTYLKWERFISYENIHNGAIRLVIKAIDHQEKINISFLLDGRSGNQVYAKHVEASNCIKRNASLDDNYLIMKVQSTGQYYVHRMAIDAHGTEILENKIYDEEKRVGYSLEFKPEQGKEFIFDKLVSVWTSRDAGFPYGLIPKECKLKEIDKSIEDNIINFLNETSKEDMAKCINQGYDILKQKHVSSLSEIWDTLDIEIKGDDLAQQGIRFCIFQLTNSYRGKDSFLNVNPKGLTSEFYQGRYFWDTESYCLPFYLFTNPKAAKGLVEYRYNTLKAAKDRAAEFGYEGAMYPWNTIDGTEDCHDWVYWGIHINGIIPYAISLYTSVTGDAEYLYSKGLEVLVEETKFWGSRAVFVPHRNAYCINRVSGPDEHQYAVNNNFYTNYLAQFTLEYTVNTLKNLKNLDQKRYYALVEMLGINEADIEQWSKIAQMLILNYDEKLDVFVQDDMFLSLCPISREELDPKKDIPIDQKWPIEKFLQYDLIKQPDVLLALLLFRNRFTKEQKTNNYRFYEQRTTHGSSLSPCIHSILASEIGRYNQAYEYYLWASRLDLDDFNQNAYQGLHVTAMAGSWMNVVYGFGGLSVNEDRLDFSPVIPDEWEEFSLKVNYRGSTIKISIDKQDVTFCITLGKPVEATIYGKPVHVSAELLKVPLPEHIKHKHRLEAVIFDLDGVIVDTAKYHYLAWKSIADKEGIYFDERINERLKGVSRMESLKIIMEKRSRDYTEVEMHELADTKNAQYVKMLENLKPDDVLPGILAFISEIKNARKKIGVFSASKNTTFILEKLGISELFDIVVTGWNVINTKPDPEGYILAAEKLGVKPENCAVIEDAFAGIQAASSAGMKNMGIGRKYDLYNADYVIPKTKYLSLEKVKMLF